MKLEKLTNVQYKKGHTQGKYMKSELSFKNLKI